MEVPCFKAWPKSSTKCPPLLKAGGLHLIAMMDDPALRKSLLSRMMPDEKIIKGFKEFEKTNIRISANNIIGFPGESREDIMLTIEINRKINPDSVVVNAFRP